MLQTLWLFYRKIIFSSVILTFLLTLLNGGFFNNWSLSFAIITFLVLLPFMQLYFYELSNKNEYYFYANLGLLKTTLWYLTLAAVVISIFITIIIL